MSKLFMFEKPLGMRDTLPNLYEVKKRVRTEMTDEITSWGYSFLDTPTLEYYETVGEASAISDQKLFKLLDQQGHTLVLRPDMTAPIARVAASRLKGESFPLRLAYDASLFRAQQREGGRPAEFEQIGTELIGDGSTSADAEVIALMASILKRTGLERFNVAIGHIGFVNSLFLEVLGNEERANILRRFLYEKNYVGYREHVKSLPLSSIDQQRLLKLLQLRGSRDVINEAKGLISNEEGIKALDELDVLWTNLESFGMANYAQLDLNLVSHMSYYTGVLFEGYAEKLGFVLCNGGRYDQLLTKFDRPAPATGFGIHLDRLLEALDQMDLKQEKICVVYSSERRQEAFELAKSKRDQGLSVVLQDISGLPNVDAFTNKFDDVIYCMGKAERESQL